MPQPRFPQLRVTFAAMALAASTTVIGGAALAQTPPASLSHAHPAKAQTTQIQTTQIQASLASGQFIKRKKRLKGSWEIVPRNGATFIVFSDDFKAATGPDLKVFLSAKSYAEVTGTTAAEGALNLGELHKTKGAQEYEIPAEVQLDDYKSVLIHCEAYSVLWGGSELTTR